MHKVIQQQDPIEIMPLDLVEFNSAGRLLIMGTARQILAVVPHLESLSLFCACTDDLELTDSATIIRQKVNSITGWLGKFSVSFESQRLNVDLVLDLSEQAMIKAKVLPLGYFAPQDDGQKLAETLQQLPDLIGTFDKPRYFNYKPSICAHSRRQLTGCQQCLDACPAEAIVSTGDTVTVNPSQCQGCGSCSAVCPSGAMSYALPTLGISVNQIRMMLKSYFELETTAPQILIHDMDKGQLFLEAMNEQLANNIVAFSIEEIGALSMAFWLSALAYGASSITVFDARSHTDHDWHELQQEIVKTNHILTGLGYSEIGVRWFSDNNIERLNAHLKTSNNVTAIEPAQFAGIDDKRRMITIALEHLHNHAPKAVNVLGLNRDAAFGEIKVDKQACTLCHACVSVCPMSAVLDGVDKPQLNFVEDLCVQCGLCETACPEDAITLIPQYLFDREQARKLRLLHEEPVFNCISCDKPFATKKMIDTMTDKLKGHAMFQGDALSRLKMCEDCRVKAIFKDTQGLVL